MLPRKTVFRRFFSVTINVAVGIPLPVVRLPGFDPKAADYAGISALHLFLAIGPAAGHFLSILAKRKLALSDS